MLGHVIKVWNRTNRWHRALGVILLLQYGGLPQRKHGFYCNDPSLSHVFNGDTISWKILLLVTLLLPLAFMFIVESYIIKEDKYSKNIDRLPKNRVLLKWYVEYCYGFVLDLVVIQVIKVSVGSPRPHFFDVCKPDIECKGSEYVSSYQCTKTIYSDIKMADSGRSFPSGHTSIAVHAAVFIAWYLYKRRAALSSKSYFIIITTQIVLVLIAVFCGISRITDRRHHWWDVLGGAILGAAILIYTVRCLCNNLDCLNVPHETAICNEHLAGKKEESGQDILDNSGNITADLPVAQN